MYALSSKRDVMEKERPWPVFKSLQNPVVREPRTKHSKGKFVGI